LACNLEALKFQSAAVAGRFELRQPAARVAIVSALRLFVV
jgi:hypothetical protein